MAYDFENNFNFERSYNSHPSGKDFIENNNFIDTEYAFSTDNVLKDLHTAEKLIGLISHLGRLKDWPN